MPTGVYEREPEGPFEPYRKPHLADVNGDNQPDIVFSRLLASRAFNVFDLEVRWIPNRGGTPPFLDYDFTYPRWGSYERGEEIATYRNDSEDMDGEIKVADLNNDTLPDVVVVRRYSQTIGGFTQQFTDFSVAFNTGGSPRFSDPVIVTTIESRITLQELADMDGDGDLDIVADIAGSGGTHLLLNTGTQQDFGPLSTPAIIVSSDVWGRGDVGDIDNDGDLDVVRTISSGADQGSINAFLNNGTANPFQGAEVVVFQGNPTPGPDSLSLIDIDADDDLDLISASMEEVVYFLNDQSADLFDATVHQLNRTPSTNSCEVNSADINSDSRVDLLVSCKHETKAHSVFLNSGSPLPYPATDVGIEAMLPGRLSFTEAVTADLDQDGDIDIVTNQNGILFNNGFRGIPMPVLSMPGGIIAAEDAGVLELPISLSRSVDYPVTLEFFTRGGEIRDFATPGVDYEEIRLDVRFDPGETEKVIRIPLLDDNVNEPTETFFAAISSYDGANLYAPGQSVSVKIADAGTDSLVDIRVADRSAFETESGGVLIFYVRLQQQSTERVGVSLATKPGSGTATQGVDYYGWSESFEFAPGETEKRFLVDLIPDLLEEGAETFELNVYNVVNASYSGGTVVGEILDDSNPPNFKIEGPDTVREGQSVQIEVVKDRSSTFETSVMVASRPGTAVQGQDFYGASSKVVFAPGETRKTLTFTTLSDSETEDEEDFFVRLFRPSAEYLRVSPWDKRIAIIDSDNDALSVISVAGNSCEEGEFCAMDLTLSRPSLNEVQVSVATKGVTAVPGTDFYGLYKVVTFEPGELAKQVLVQTLDDTLDEPEKTLEGRIFSASGASIASDGDSTLLSIRDND